MSYRLNEAEGAEMPPAEDPIRRWLKMLQDGTPEEKQRALRSLVRRRAESALVECLRLSDPLTVSLATSGLWDCWLNERGRNARKEIERGIALMETAEYAAAEDVFLGLMLKFPDWAEAKNKQATLLYLRGQPAVSLLLCQEVVQLKPHHFGAWNGIALCAAQLKDWRKVLQAAKQALQLQPHSEANEQLLQMARENLADESEGDPLE